MCWGKLEYPKELSHFLVKTSAVKKPSRLGSEAASSIPQVPAVTVILITIERNHSHTPVLQPSPSPVRVEREALLSGEM